MPSVTCTGRSPGSHWPRRGTLAHDGLAVAVIIERRTCPCCGGERPDPGRDPDCRAAARRSTTPPGRRCRHRASRGPMAAVPRRARVDVRIDGWDIRGRWFGVVVEATPRTGELRRGETIPWRVIAAQIAPRERGGSPDQIEPALDRGSISPLLSATSVNSRGSAASSRSSAAPPRS